MRTKSRLAKKYWVIIFLLAVLLLAGQPLYRFFSGLVARPATALVEVASDSSSFGWQGLKMWFNNRKTLENRLLKLETENSQLRSQLAGYEILQTDYRKLRELTGQAATEPEPIIAQIISQPKYSPYDVLLIDIGFKNATKKIFVGQEAFIGDRVLVGYVTEIHGQTAKVKLLSSSGEKIPVKIGVGNISGQAEGRGGGNFSVILPRGLEIKVGDWVMHASSTGSILGRVGGVKKSTINPFQTVFFNQPYNLFQLKWIKLFP